MLRLLFTSISQLNFRAPFAFIRLLGLRDNVSSCALAHCALLLSLSFLSGCQHFVRSHLGREPHTDDFRVLTTPEDQPFVPKARAQSAKQRLPASFKAPVSLHISQELPLHIALEQTCKLLGIDVQIDKRLQNPRIYIPFAATKKPFIDVLESICALAKLRYKLCNGMLFVEPDTPYNRNYNVQFLNLTRSSENRISSGTDIFAHSVANSDGKIVAGSGNGSNTSVNMNSENDFWKELEINLQTLLASDNSANEPHKEGAVPMFTIHKHAGIVSVRGNSEQHHCVQEYLDALKRSASSQILIEAKIIEVTLNDEFKSGINWGMLEKEEGQTLASKTYGGINYENKDATGESVFENTVIPTGTGTSVAADGATTADAADAAAAVVAGAAGTVASTVATASAASAASDAIAAGTKKMIAPSGFFQFTKTFSNGIAGLIKALQYFGETRTLSSPRLTVMNNQSALLKVAENHVYFKLNYSKHLYSKSDREDISLGSDIKTVPVGLVMAVQPAIDQDSQSVILFLRPTISSLVKNVADPSVAIAMKSAGGTNLPTSEIPVIQVKEIDSVLRLKDGEVAVLGGLMEISSTHDRFKHPVFGDIPIIKEAFSNLNKSDRVKEIVILIRVRILDVPFPDKADERLVHLYTTDPRPIC
ncbi:MAG: secretin N-terminal domain-containing protein [Holosporales bacterium]|jgi:general secretion pathway protein D|nr:secretin N-terminal domain-containing protein [Holosporales bacterium]